MRKLRVHNFFSSTLTVSYPPSFWAAWNIVQRLTVRGTISIEISIALTIFLRKANETIFLWQRSKKNNNHIHTFRQKQRNSLRNTHKLALCTYAILLKTARGTFYFDPVTGIRKQLLPPGYKIISTSPSKQRKLLLYMLLNRGHWLIKNRAFP